MTGIGDSLRDKMLKIKHVVKIPQTGYNRGACLETIERKNAMSTVLITGANRGIGLEFARQYSAAGWQVIATCRRPQEGGALETLPVEIRPLDMTDIESFPAFAAGLKGRPMDLLLNNAGLYGLEERQSLGRVDVAEWQRVMMVDVFAPLKLVENLIDNLALSERPVVGNLSSKMGSMADNTSGGIYLYRSAKAALNAVSKSLAVDLRARGILVVALHPGWVKTDMGGPNALIPVDVSVTGLRRVIAGLTPADSGRFLAFDGHDVPW